MARVLFSTRKRTMMVFMLVLLLGGGYWIYETYFHLSPTARAERELASAVASVSKLMLLPDGDQPVLATVADAKTLKSQQSFFARSENGDQLLLFPKTLQAILYRPKSNLIVNVGPIQYDNQSSGLQSQDANGAVKQQNSTAGTASRLMVEIRNGSGKAGQGATIAKSLESNASYQVTHVDDAKRNDYQKTIVVNLRGQKKPELTQALAAALHAEVVDNLPEGETNSSADVLVILGAQ